uniref:Cytochrome b6-f complex subunit PetP n=1 Tax=Chondria tumulosa TaxID=2740715 RepID=A0A896ST33_9FLOR|nr:cytochrome b6-f complex subunit PetP [Chondria tumulosa]QSD57133.1 cytochrome b6-f complex subunit PetP [Chondria tumulosa]
MKKSLISIKIMPYKVKKNCTLFR